MTAFGGGDVFEVMVFEVEIFLILFVSKGFEGSEASVFVVLVVSLDLNSKKFPFLHVYTDTVFFHSVLSDTLHIPELHHV